MIELEHYKPHPEKPGYLQFDRRATVEEVFDQCTEALKAAGLYEDLDYFHDSNRYRTEPQEWPRARWVACFPVEGGSEGHYTHVEAIALMEDQGKAGLSQTDERQLMMLGKTFMGLEHAIQVCAVLVRAFYQFDPSQPLIIEEVTG